MWFAWLADLAVKSTAVLAIAWIAALVLRGRSAAVRHLVWAAASAALLALPFLSASLPELPVRGAGAILPSAGVMFQITATARPTATAAQTSPQILAAGPFQPGPWRPDWASWIALIWITGTLAFCAQMLVASVRMSRVRRSCKPWRDSEGGIPHEVDVLEAPAGSMPMTYGFLRPAVFLPADAVQWSGELRRAVLLHELAHVRRGDVATQLLARLALTLHWWNPLAWTGWRQFLKEREHAADDLVLAAGERASDYAGHLLQMARSRQSTAALAWAAVCMARRSQLETRLTAILDGRMSRAAISRKSVLAAVLAAIAIAAPLASIRAERVMPPSAAPLVPPAIQVVATQPPAPAVRPPDPPERSSVAYGVGLLKIAELERSRHREGEAEAFYIKAANVLGDRPEAAPAWLHLGIRQRNPVTAIEYLRKAERLDVAQTGTARMWIAVMHERLHQPEEAEALYKSALAVQPSASTQRLYARLLRQQGREEEAQSIEKQSVAARPATTGGPGVYRVGNGVKPPSLIAKVEPEYSEEARAAKYQGTVVIYAEIGTDGRAHNMQVVRGLGLGLDEKAMFAIDRWQFRPGSKDGAPVPVSATIEVNFRLL